MRGPDQYLDQLQRLLPPGTAWTRAPDAALTMLLGAWAEEFARLDARGLDLMREADPRTAFEMLADWERALGLPDDCTDLATTINARQAACWAKLAARAGQTPAFYVALAASLGFTVVIHEFDPDVDDYDSGPDISDGRWRYVWRVEVLDQVDFSVFRAGSSSAGDLLVQGGAADLECVIRKAAPAHTHVVFTYP